MNLYDIFAGIDRHFRLRAESRQPNSLDNLYNLLERVRYELVTVNGLLVTDVPTQNTYRLDTEGLIEQIDALIGQLPAPTEEVVL